MDNWASLDAFCGKGKRGAIKPIAHLHLKWSEQLLAIIITQHGWIWTVWLACLLYFIFSFILTACPTKVTTRMEPAHLNDGRVTPSTGHQLEMEQEFIHLHHNSQRVMLAIVQVVLLVIKLDIWQWDAIWWCDLFYLVIFTQVYH